MFVITGALRPNIKTTLENFQKLMVIICNTWWNLVIPWYLLLAAFPNFIRNYN